MTSSSPAPAPAPTRPQTADALAAQIAERCGQARQTSEGWMVCCPAHDDKHPSLKIDFTHDRVLLHCYAHCLPEAITAALGMTMADLFVGVRESKSRDDPIVATYDYHDEAGTLVHQTVRYQSKRFSQRRPDPFTPDAWIWNLKTITTVPYQLPRVLAAIGRGEPIYLPEGEKDVESLMQLGLTGTCNAMGAGKWAKRYSQYLCGATVYLLPDHDKPGADHVQDVAKKLQGYAAQVSIVNGIHTAAAGSDVSDWFAAGHTRAELEAAAAAAPPYTATPQSNDTQSPRQRQNGQRRTTTETSDELRQRFRVDDQGVWYRPPEDKDGNQPPDVFVCAPLRIVAATRDVDNNNHGHLLEFSDRHGHAQQWAMPLELLEEQKEYRKVLRRLGLRMNSNARAELQRYLDVCDAKERARCVDRVGWYEGAYVLPDTTLGETGEERLVLQNLDRHSEGYRQAGTLEAWKAEIAKRCVGNSRLLLAASTGFAAPLLEPLGEESGGLHFRGASSEGKTTAVLVAATVWGEPGRLERWRATANALEGVALAHNDNLLCLDELKELDPREAGGVAYMLANGAGKRRGQPHGGTRPRLTWRLLFLSTGETSLEQHIAEAGQRIQAGQEVRLVDVPADAGAEFGVFEYLHGASTSKAFADQLREATTQNYGHAGRAFISELARDSEKYTSQLQTLRDDFVAKHVPAGAGGQVYRVAQRFALIGAAGELATQFGLTDWPADEALVAAARCFNDWLSQRGGIGNAEEARALSQVRLFFERYGEARFKPWTLSDGTTCERCLGSGHINTTYKGGKCFDCNGKGRITPEMEPSRQMFDRAGFRRGTEDGRTEFYVLPEVFRADIGKGFDPQWLGRLLVEHQLLYVDTIGKPQCPQRLPGMGLRRVYHFRPEILGEKEHEEVERS